MLESTEVKFMALLGRLVVATEALALEGLEERIERPNDAFNDEWLEAVQQVAANWKGRERKA